MMGMVAVHYMMVSSPYTNITPKGGAILITTPSDTTRRIGHQFYKLIINRPRAYNK